VEENATEELVQLVDFVERLCEEVSENGDVERRRSLFSW
jgi:hypothetical protein